MCWLHYVTVLQKAGFPPSSWEELTGSSDFHIETYCDYCERERKAPKRDSDISHELSEVLKTTKQLSDALSKLSHPTRRAILDAKAYVLPGVVDDPWELRRSLQELAQRATTAAQPRSG